MTADATADVSLRAIKHRERSELHRLRELDHALARYHFHTLTFAPTFPRPLPGELEAQQAGQPWDIYRVLAELDRIRPIEMARTRAWFAHRRADIPVDLKAHFEARAAEFRALEAAAAQAASRPPGERKRNTRLAHLTHAEKRLRKLQQTRESNQRKRFERMNKESN